ncbi:hypothetical protein [Brevundimonas sp. NIBR11]|uniref:hypothetical protein n=1 Tax=Brevundimonas sp. NIBR11 TaxID=3015999 RepID=UPI0022F0F2E0|nr:hypothetical protein [Brevundimonas sp. NIBR11]WGM31467.1 hypothetical protein KKHFBJBL_01714 [Brevundimonas sp. NIBR11]
MNAFTFPSPAGRPAEPILRPANEDAGFRPLSSILPTVVGDVFATLTSFEPRYGVQDGMIITLSSGRRQTTEQARRALGHYLQDALTVPQSDLVDIDLIHVAHLVRAIRAAEGTDKTPPTEPMAVAA